MPDTSALIRTPDGGVEFRVGDLLIKPFEERDMMGYMTLRSDPQVMQLVKDGEIFTFEQTFWEILGKRRAQLLEEGTYLSDLSIFIRDGYRYKFAGFITLKRDDSLLLKQSPTTKDDIGIEISARLNPEYWSRSIMTQVGDIVLHNLNSYLGAIGIRCAAGIYFSYSYITTSWRNTSTQRIAGKLAFIEGRNTMLYGTPTLTYYKDQPFKDITPQRQELPKDITRDALLKLVRQDGMLLGCAPFAFGEDREIVETAAKENYRALEFADYALLKNKNFVMGFVRHNGLALCYVSPKTQDYKEVVLAAVRQNGRALAFVWRDFKIHKSLKVRGNAGIIINDEKIVEAATLQNPFALQYASDELKRKRDFILRLLAKQGLALFATPDFHSDPEIVVTAVKQRGIALMFASNPIKDNYDIALAAVKQCGFAVYAVSDTLKENLEIALAAVGQNGRALQCIDESWFSVEDYRKIVTAAVKNDGYALRYAQNLQKDKDIVKLAVRRGGFPFKYAHDDLKHDKDFILEILAIAGSALEHVPDELKNDPDNLEHRELAAIALRASGLALRYAPAFQDDKSMVLIAVKENGEALQFSSKRLRSDKEIIKNTVQFLGKGYQYIMWATKHSAGFFNSLIRKDWRILEFIPTDKITSTLYKFAVRANIKTLRYIPEDKLTPELYQFAKEHIPSTYVFKEPIAYIPPDKRTPKLYAIAIQKNEMISKIIPPEHMTPKFLKLILQRDGKALQFAHEDLKKDKQVVMQAVKQDGEALQFAHEDLRKDREFVMQAVKQDCKALYFAHEDLRKDKQVVMQAVKQDGEALEFAHEDLKKDKEFMLQAVKQHGLALYFAHEDFKKDREVVLQAVKQDGKALYLAHDDLKKDKQIVLQAVKQDGRALYFAHEDFRKDKQIVLQAVKTRR